MASRSVSRGVLTRFRDLGRLRRGAANHGCSRLSRRLRARPPKRVLLLQSRDFADQQRGRLKRRLQPRLAAPRRNRPKSRKRVSTPLETDRLAIVYEFVKSKYFRKDGPE